MATGIKIKLTRKQARALRDLYATKLYTESLKWVDELRRAHAVAMYQRLYRMLMLEWAHKTLKMDECEAVAFYDTWRGTGVSEYHAVLINEIIQVIDKVHKQNLIANGKYAPAKF
jgi:hypothetical protein